MFDKDSKIEGSKGEQENRKWRGMFSREDRGVDGRRKGKKKRKQGSDGKCMEGERVWEGECGRESVGGRVWE